MRVCISKPDDFGEGRSPPENNICTSERVTREGKKRNECVRGSLMCQHSFNSGYDERKPFGNGLTTLYGEISSEKMAIKWTSKKVRERKDGKRQ